MPEANLGGVFRLYRASLARCWLAALLFALTWLGSSMLLDRRLPATDDLFERYAQIHALMWSGYFWRVFAVVAVLSTLCYCAMVAEIHALAVGGAAPAAGGLAPALRVLPGALLAATIFLVGTSMATMLFVVPGAWLWGMWQLWLVVLVVEHSGPITSLQRSWQLVSGAWWRITTLVTVVALIAIVPAMVFDAVLGGTLVLAGMSPGEASTVVFVASGILDLFLLPLVPAALVAAYLDRSRAQAVSAQG